MKLFITGIGTDVGKSWATGWLANKFAAEGKTVITQKFIQTGNTGMSEDIELHRRIMGIPLQKVDLNHITCPIIFTYPASPHLAAAIDGRQIDLGVVDNASAALEKEYEMVLIEGAGGLMVPVTEDFLTIDYIKSRMLPAVLVTNGKLGSISDTLLTLEALGSRGIKLYAVVYNPHFDSDKTIAEESRKYMRRYVEKHFPEALWLEMGLEMGE